MEFEAFSPLRHQSMSLTRHRLIDIWQLTDMRTTFNAKNVYFLNETYEHVIFSTGYNKY